MSNQLRIQVRGPNNKNIRLALPTTATYKDIVDQIRSSFNGINDFILHTGTPPKIQEIDGSNPSVLLSTLGVRSGDTIIVELGGNGTTMVQGSGWDLPPTVDTRSRVVHYKVPGDNSCLFHSIGAALMRKNPSAQLVQEIKKVVEKQILSNPKSWTIAELGESPSSYIQQLHSPGFWGGAIEIAIISAQYQVEISVVDYASLCITTFAHYPDDTNDTEGFKRRIYLMYDGSNLNAAHYDLITATSESSRASALTGMEASAADKDTITSFDNSLQSIFRPADETVLTMIKKLAEIQHDRLVREGKTAKKQWTEKDMIKNKDKKPKFSGGKGALGETANIGNHMSLQPTTTTTTTTTQPTPTPVKPVTTTTTNTTTRGTTTTTTAPATITSTADWNCDICTYANSYARTFCEMCDAPKPKQVAAVSKPTPQPTTTTAPTQQSKPTTTTTTTTTTVTPTPQPTQQPKPVPQQPKPTPTSPSSTASTATSVNRPWTCSSCTYSNRGSAESCDMCDLPRTGGSAPPKKVTTSNNNPKPSDVLSKPPSNNNDANSDWECQSCKTRNHHDATKCRSCNQKKGDCTIM